MAWCRYSKYIIFRGRLSRSKDHFPRTKLSINKTILTAANEVIKHNTERKPKGLWTANNGGEKIKYYEAMTERDEAEYVVREIIKHRKSEKTIMIWQFCIEQMHNHVC